MLRWKAAILLHDASRGAKKRSRKPCNLLPLHPFSAIGALSQYHDSGFIQRFDPRITSPRRYCLEAPAFSIEERLMGQIDHQLLANELIGAVHLAGARILDHYGKADVELKSDNSPVTVADREADAVLVETLSRIAPSIPVISEESSPSAQVADDRQFFLVDPLDGTKEFIHGRDEFTVNVALIENRTPRFGIVYAPALGRAYVTLAPGRAAKVPLDARAPMPNFGKLEFTPIETRAPDHDDLVAAISRSHLDEKTEAFLAQRGISRTHASGSSLKFCSLAEGLADVYPRFGRTMEWDTAAGHAVLAAAGGSVLDETGRSLTYGKLDDKYANPGFVAWGRAP